jgi:hypothetical protein
MRHLPDAGWRFFLNPECGTICRPTVLGGGTAAISGVMTVACWTLNVHISHMAESAHHHMGSVRNDNVMPMPTMSVTNTGFSPCLEITTVPRPAVLSPSASAVTLDQLEPGGQFAIGAASANDGSIGPTTTQTAVTQMKKASVMIAASYSSS